MQMEGVRVFFPGDWETSGMDGTSYAAEDLILTLPYKHFNLSLNLIHTFHIILL